MPLALIGKQPGTNDNTNTANQKSGHLSKSGEREGGEGSASNHKLFNSFQISCQ